MCLNIIIDHTIIKFKIFLKRNEILEKIIIDFVNMKANAKLLDIHYGPSFVIAGGYESGVKVHNNKVEAYRFLNNEPYDKIRLPCY